MLRLSQQFHMIAGRLQWLLDDQDQGNGCSHACAQKGLSLAAGITSYAESKKNTATVPAPERL